MAQTDGLFHNFPYNRLHLSGAAAGAAWLEGGVARRLADLENCRRCGALFVKEKMDYCADCVQWFMDTYVLIRDYLRQHPRRTLWDVHKELGIPLSAVQQVIRFSEEKEESGRTGHGRFPSQQ